MNVVLSLPPEQEDGARQALLGRLAWDMRLMSSGLADDVTQYDPEDREGDSEGAAAFWSRPEVRICCSLHYDVHVPERWDSYLGKTWPGRTEHWGMNICDGSLPGRPSWDACSHWHHRFDVFLAS